MTIHLDTNYLVEARHPGSAASAAVADWLNSGARLGSSSVAWSEYLCGPLSAAERTLTRALVGTPVALLEADAELAARLFNLGGRRRGSLADCQIAAIAMRSGAVLATSDRAGFSGFTAAGLRLAPEGA